MIIQLDPGTRAAGEAPDGLDASRSSRRCPTSTSTRSSRRWTRDTRDYLQLLVGGAADGLDGEGDGRCPPTLKRFEPTGARPAPAQRRAGDRRANIRRSIHNFRLLVEAVGEKDDELAALVDSSNAVFRSFADQDAEPARGAAAAARRRCARRNTALAKADTLGHGPRADARRPAARRPRARADARADAAVPAPRRRRSSATSCGRSRATRCRRSRDLRPGRARPRGRDARPDRDVQGRQLPVQRARLQPAGHGGGLPVLGRRGPTTSARSVFAQPGRARPDPPRPGRWRRARRCAVLDIDLADQRRSSARSARCSNPPEPDRRLPATTRPARPRADAPRPAAEGTGG